MKIFKRLTALMLALTLVLSACPAPSIAETNTGSSAEMRGLWVASVLNIDYPSKATVDSETLKREAITVLDKAQKTGLNAIFLQVRPTADALYPSKYFPWSKYLTGRQGTAPSGSFDPLAFWVSEAHKRGIQLHAWINPYRITKKMAKDPVHDFASLTPDHPANQHPEWVVKHSDGNLYFNPGLPEVRQYIIDSSLEIVQNYDVDGIHFDDYFYPGETFGDADTFKARGTGFASLADWRRDNVNQLVEGMSKALKQSGKKVAFGISPFGIWANKKTNALGSDTSGLQSYSSHYADTRKWVKDGSIDYIAPQLYWNIGFKVADYEKLVRWWQDVVKGTGVKLYIGQAAYRTGSTDASNPWYGVQEIQRQLDLNASIPEISGSIYYNWSALKRSSQLADLLSSYYGKNPVKTGISTPTPSKPSASTATPVSPPVVVTVSEGQKAAQPAMPLTLALKSGLKTSSKAYFVSGSSDPNQPLLINGQDVAVRSSKGYFGYYAPLRVGNNVLVFKQGSITKTLTLIRTVPEATSSSMKRAEIVASSTFPQTPEMRMAGEKVTLACTAPAGASVTVRLGESTYTMTPSSSTSKTGLIPVRYTYTLILDTPTDTSAPTELGRPVYTMSYAGIERSQTAPASLSAIAPGTSFYAQITEDVAETYTGPTSSNGSNGELYKDMVDRITAVSAGYLKLSAGTWIKKDKAKTLGSEVAFSPVVTSSSYMAGEKWDTLNLGMTQIPAANMAFDGSKLTLTLGGASAQSPSVLLPENSLFESVGVQNLPNTLVYTLKLKAGQSLSGYILRPEGNNLVLEVKRKPVVTNSARPLEGLTILLDPGHGGSDTGAIGPLGATLAEEHVNLNVALKLEQALTQLGARVEMTRRTDQKVTLAERLSQSRSLRPDLFVSVHANSMDYSVDLNKVSGFSVYYNKPVLSKTISDQVLSRVLTDLGRKDRGAHVMNFYVTKGSWSPSLLIETGFMPNPVEFEWLTDESANSALAGKLADSIVAYFSQL